VARVLLAALSVSGAIFLILELDQPFDGVIQISQRFNAQRSCASRPLAAGNFCSAFKNPNDRSWEIFLYFRILLEFVADLAFCNLDLSISVCF
jgi:hypothetical protein